MGTSTTIKRNVTKEIKLIARERVGRVKSGKIIQPKTKLSKRLKILSELANYNQELGI